jgi:hypothetical protein
MNHKEWLVPAVFVIVGGAAGFAYAATVTDKVNICHATGSAKNPYVLIQVSPKALAGHDHAGDFIAGPGATNCNHVPPPPPGEETL